MKRILITGANSYVGTSFENYVKQWPDKYQVDTISIHGDGWRKKNFSQYDSIFHVAGIAHSDTGHASQETRARYYRVNTNLTIEVATKAKNDGAKQFIFMSSIIVYGDSAPIGKNKVITKDTVPCPSNFYGDSKLQAENGILPLNDERFHVAIIRAPMIYGKGCKGNYQTLVKVALKMPFFPYVKNQRSMLYIENLCEFVRLMVTNNDQGLFWPQNAEYSNTSEMVKMVAEAHGRKIRLARGTGWMLELAGCFTRIIHKAFGSMSYVMTISEYRINYREYTLSSSVKKMEIDNG
ncbi:NAD-dependent epimerase/dehydratase family protein [Oscillospiraceae bacterium LTW-04]|nr:NAD-dependent epimerase/dehydratase family protein [Oscillospiraceae bacterium MB24-C1]